MIDKRTEENIKDLGSFVESWLKFQGLYRQLVSKERVSREDEDIFFETKKIMAERYDALKANLDFKYVPFSRLTDPVSEVLALENVLNMSEKRSRKIEADWNDSYIFLNNIIERLENRKRRLEDFNPLGVWVKRFRERIGEKMHD